MEKDEQYVDVDDKQNDNDSKDEFKDTVNEGVRYVKDYVSDKDNQEKIKKGAKVAKKVGIGYLVFIGIIIILVIAGLIFGVTMYFKASNKMNKFESQFEENAEKMQNQFEENKEDILNQFEEKNEEMLNQFEGNEPDMNMMSFNTPFEVYSGIKHGGIVNNLLERIATNNQKAENIILVEYKETSASLAEEILNIENSIENIKEYQVLFSYDDSGYINKATITEK